MSEIKKNQRDFIVRESAVVLLITAIVFLCMILSFLEYNANAGIWGYVVVAILFPVAIYFIRKKVTKAVMVINSNGIYSHNRLVVDWKQFRSAKIDQLPMTPGDPRDKVVLIIHYLDPVKGKLYEQKIRLNNTFNKSEEQILAAIEKFRHLK